MGSSTSEWDRAALQAVALRATNEFMDENGMAGVTFEGVAERAGLAAESLQKIFKEVEFMTCLAALDRLHEMTNDYVGNMPDVCLEDKILFIIQKRVDFVIDNLEEASTFYIKGLLGEAPWSEALDRMIWQLSIHFATLLEHGVRRGEVRTDVDVSVAVKTLVSIYLSGVVTIGFRATEFDVQKIIDFLKPQISLFLAGLKPCTLPES